MRFRGIPSVALAIVGALFTIGCETDDRHVRDAATAAGGGIEGPKTMERDVVETLLALDGFDTLAQAMTVAGLMDALQEDGPFTLFAPRESAFAKLEEVYLQTLMKDEPALREVLTYHVVPGRLRASDVSDRESLETMQGRSLEVRSTGEAVTVDLARIVQPDIRCSNGVIHVIDTVLIPE